jgi:hypothetical protein
MNDSDKKKNCVPIFQARSWQGLVRKIHDLYIFTKQFSQRYVERNRETWWRERFFWDLEFRISLIKKQV